jgi:hypothetical protein
MYIIDWNKCQTQVQIPAQLNLVLTMMKASQSKYQATLFGRIQFATIVIIMGAMCY